MITAILYFLCPRLKAAEKVLMDLWHLDSMAYDHVCQYRPDVMLHLHAPPNAQDAQKADS